MDYQTYFRHYPDQNGRFGPYGGQYLPPELKPAFDEIAIAYETICHSAQFINELRRIRREFQGRPTPLYHCNRLSRKIGCCQIYLKREDLNHSGAHKLNHCMGEALLAHYMGKKRLIAETGAGQHGVALATAAAYFGLECEIHMGEVDIVKQAPNVARMKILGANVVPVSHGLKTLKEAVDSAFESYLKNYRDSIYCIGSVVGPHPFPMMVRDFQMCIGIETREQFLEMTGLLPDAVTACVGGGSNAAGMFSAFLGDPVDLYGVEPLGKGPEIGQHAASITYGKKESFTDLKVLCYRIRTAIRRRSIPMPADLTIPPSDRNTLSGQIRNGSITSPFPMKKRLKRSLCFPVTKGSFRRSKAPTLSLTP